MTQKLKSQVINASHRSWWLYRYGKHWIIQCDDYWGIYNAEFNRSNSGELLLHYNKRDEVFRLYTDIDLKYLQDFCEALEIDLPYVKLEGKLVVDINNSDKIDLRGNNGLFTDHSRDIIPYRYSTDSYYDSYAYNWRGLDEKEHVEFKAWHYHILDGELLKFEEHYGYRPYWIPRELTVNGVPVEVKSYYRHSGTFLCIEKEYAGKNITIPVSFPSLERKKDCVSKWGNLDYIRNKSKLQMLISQEDLDLPENFNWDKISLHFYGKVLDLYELEKYLKTDCECIMCKGYDILKDNGVLSFFNWETKHLELRWAGKHGRMPDDKDYFICQCSWCKRMRKTKYFVSYNKKLVDKKLKNILGSSYAYYTLEGRVNYKFNWIDMPKYEEDLKFSDLISPIFREDLFKYRSYSTSIRSSLSIIHCWNNGVRFEDVGETSRLWLKEVYETLLQPKCNCPVCNSMKNTEIGKIAFNELILENIPVDAYPVGVFNRHFRSDLHYYPFHLSDLGEKQEETKESFIKYFKDFILVGKQCPCVRCQEYFEMVKDSEYLPPEELKTPKCPLCGNRIHDKNLIYNSSDISKKIVEQNLGMYIGVRTALCCSCYGREMDRLKNMDALIEAGDGSVVKADGKRATKRKGKIGKISLGEYLTLHEDFEILKAV